MPKLSRRGFTTLAASVAASATWPEPLNAATSATRTLGKNGPKVPPVGIGCNNFGGTIDEAATKRVIDAALDSGAALFDTANVYASGRSEEFIGRALGARRSRAIIATKFGNPMRSSNFPQGGASRAVVIEAVEASLKRLGTDYIDLFQLHVPDPKAPIEETLRAMDDVVRQGKVRFVGHSNFDGVMTHAAAKVSADNKITAFVSAQNQYSLLTRDIEKELVPACMAHGLGVLPYFPLESGLLTGKYKRGEKPAEGTRMANWASRAPEATERFLNDDKFTKVEKLQALCEANGNTLLDMAFGWLLNKPYIATVIAGATKPEQVEANVKAAAWRPSPEIDNEIDKVTKAA